MAELLLYISPIGYSLFEIPSTVDIAPSATNKTFSKFNLFSKICNQLFSFNLSADIIDTDILSVQNKQVPQTLRTFITDHVQPSDNLHVPLSSLIIPLQTSCSSLNIINNENTQTFYRSIKSHFLKYVPESERVHFIASQRHLSHLIFRNALSFDFGRSDENLVQTYGLYLSTKKVLDKLIDTLISAIQENQPNHKKDKNNKENKKDKINRKNVLEKTKQIENLNEHIKWIIKKIESNTEILNVIKANLKKKVKLVAPNLNNLIGVDVTCELILRAGSLIKLAHCTSNVIQFFGAEKELFQSLKKRKNTPKYGILAETLKTIKKKEKSIKKKKNGNDRKNKELGKLVKAYSVKCSLASKVDAYKIESNDGKYGKQLKKELTSKFK